MAPRAAQGADRAVGRTGQLAAPEVAESRAVQRRQIGTVTFLAAGHLAVAAGACGAIRVALWRGSCGAAIVSINHRCDGGADALGVADVHIAQKGVVLAALIGWAARRACAGRITRFARVQLAIATELAIDVCTGRSANRAASIAIDERGHRRADALDVAGLRAPHLSYLNAGTLCSRAGGHTGRWRITGLTQIHDSVAAEGTVCVIVRRT